MERSTEESRFNAYIRDSIEDNGAEPAAGGRLWASPDIIVRASQVPDPQTELGETVKHRHDLSDDAEDGQDNFIYLRVQNRGDTAGDCSARIYFTDPGMFHNPASWTDLGELSLVGLSPGEFRVVGPLVWPDAQVPHAGHFCLIAVLDSPEDPAPDLAAIHSEADFVAMVRGHNNVAWKNIHVVDLFPGMMTRLEFYLEGPSGPGHRADLHVDAGELPQDTEVTLRLLARLVDGATTVDLSEAGSSTRYANLKMDDADGAIEDMRLRSGERVKVVLTMGFPENTADGDYPVRVTFDVDGDTVGAYTDVARVSYSGFIGNRSSRELHRRGCPYLHLMAVYHRVPFGDMQKAHRAGYDNCAYCIGGSKR